MSRTLLDVVNTPGYVSIIEGQPGTGKTSLALKACAARGKCTYISYADPEYSINAKLKAVAPDFKGSIRVVSMMTGKVDRVFSEIESSLAKDELVVVDSLDAMFYGVKDESEIRSFLQMLYGSVKGKNDSLVLISEGINPVAQQIRFVCDAIISMSFENVLGQNMRSVKLLKDRDHLIEQQLRYITFSGNFHIIEPFYMLKKPVLGRYRMMQRSPSAEIEAERELGYNILIVMDEGLSEIVAGLLRKTIAADFIKNGLNVNYLIGPNEDKQLFVNDMKSLVGQDIDRLNIIVPDAKAANYSSDQFLKQITSAYRENAVNIVNLMSEEDFAVKNLAEYDLFINKVLNENVKRGRISIKFGYATQEAVKPELKYANILRRMTVTDGFVFWRSLRPLGPVYCVDMKQEEGTVDFIEMV